MNRSLVVSAVLALTAVPAGLCEQSPQADLDRARQAVRESREVLDLVRKLESRYRDLGPFSVTFEQSFESATFGQEEVERGTMHVQPPDKMLWEYDVPAGQRAVLNGPTWWLVSESDREIYRRDRTEGEPEPLTDLLAGRLDVLAIFSVRPSIEPPQHRRGVVLELLPKQPREDVELALVELDSKKGDLRRLELFDPLGNRVVFRLGAPHSEKPLPVARYEVEVPEEYDLVAE